MRKVQEITVRQLKGNEVSRGLELVWEVFKVYEAPDYPKEGIEEFYKSIHDPNYLSMLQIFGAFREEKIVGVIATRNGGSHVALFFVAGKYHRQGIGKKLFETVLAQCTQDEMTVNAAPYAVPIYEKLGFKITDEEQSVNGVRYNPMIRKN